MEHMVNSLEELNIFSRKIKKHIETIKDSKKSLAVFLYGELGSGKTSFVKALAKNFGIEENVVSPTYFIRKDYKIKCKTNFDYLIHMDLYRIKTSDEFEFLGIQKLFNKNSTLFCVEWPEILEDYTDIPCIRLKCSSVGNTHKYEEFK